MRQGRLQPFKVATGWYGRPLGGDEGGRIVAESVDTISGSAASALLPTAVAAIARPAPPKKCLRVNMRDPCDIKVKNCRAERCRAPTWPSRNRERIECTHRRSRFGRARRTAIRER